MDDLINHDTNYILQDQDGVKWHFYLSENKKIMYTNDRQGDWSIHEYIDSQPVKGFSAAMDSTGVFHIVAYTITRQLLYYEFVNGKWSGQVIERIYSRFQDIPYFSIYSSALGVHILCYINHSLSRSGETLVHYYLHEGKWHGGRLWKFMSDQMTTFQSACIDHNNKLHMLFTQKWRQRTHLYYCTYDPLTLSWVEPIAIHSSSSPHSCQIYVDHSENLHILWSKAIEQQHQIRYLLKLSGDVHGGWRESVIHEGPHKVKVPVMIEDGDLYCFWKEDKAIYKMYSKDSGLTWSAPELLRDSLDYHLTLHNFVYLDKGIPKTINIWGQGYPNIRLAGIDWHPISTKRLAPKGSQPHSLSSNQDASQRESIEWVDVKRGIASIRQENKSLREAVNNLFSQIDHLNSIIYSLQDQLQMNERSLFNINAQIKQLDFQIKQLQLRSRQASPKIYDMQNVKYQPLPIRMDEDGKIITGKEAKKEPEVQKEPSVQKELDLGETSYEQEKSVPAELAESDTNKKFEKQEEMEVSAEQEQVDKTQNLDKIEDDNTSIENKKENKKVKNKPLEDKDIEDGIIKNEVVENEIIRNESLDIETTKTYEEKKDTQRISLGNTVILINPEDPEDL